MGRSKFRKVTLGSYNKCLLCDYEVKNNKRAMILHFRYSHPNEDPMDKKNDRIVCAVCKKPDCRLH